MGVLLKATVIVVGALIGGGIGFYWRETYWLDENKKKKNELEMKLEGLVLSRKQKEDSIQNK